MNGRLIFTLVTLSMTIGNLFGAVHGLKPEIQHKFREAEKEPPVLFVLLFAFLVATPALILIYFWSRTVSLKFETLTLRRIIFHTLFLMVLHGYSRFWLGMNMFDTMISTGPLIVLMFYVFN